MIFFDTCGVSNYQLRVARFALRVQHILTFNTQPVTRNPKP